MLGRCIIQFHSRYQASDDNTSTAGTLGLGVCCVLSMYGFGYVAGDEIHINLSSDPKPSSILNTLQGNELISTYCGTRFNSIPCEDRFDWIRKVEARLRCLDFVSSALSEHPYELHACIIQVNATLVEANLHTKPIFTGAEVIAIQIVRDVLIQLNDAITRFCPESFPTRFWEGILNLKNRGPASSNTPSQNTDGAWHSRAQNLLVKALAAQRQVPDKAEMVWDQMAEVLSEAEEIIRTRCFSDVELKTLAHIFQAAVDFAPVWPCVAQCAKVWFEMRESANKVKKLHPNVDPVLPPQQLPVFLREDVILEKPQNVFQGSTPFNGLESHNSEQVARSDLSRPLSHPQSITLDSGQHQVQQQTTQHDSDALDKSDWMSFGAPLKVRLSEPPQQSVFPFFNGEPAVVDRAGPPQQSVFPISNHDPAVVDRAGPPQQSVFPISNYDPAVVDRAGPPQQSVFPISNYDPAVVDRAENGNRGTPQRADNSASLLQQLQQQVSRLQFPTFTTPAVQSSVQGTRQLIQLNQTLSDLNQMSPALNAQSLTVLSKVRSSLVGMRQWMKSGEKGYLSPSHMAKVSEALVNVSRLWHLARLAHLKTPVHFKAEELQSLAILENSIDLQSLPAFVASETYAALLRQDSSETLNGLLVVLESTSDPIDLSTAKLLLLNLLYLKYDKVELLRPEAQDPLSKLISRLRHGIFEAKETEIVISRLPEFNDFCLANFKQRPLTTYLKQYEDHFSRSLSQDLTPKRAIDARQLDLLKAFRSHILRIGSPIHISADEETLAYIKQFSAFADARLDESQVDGCQTIPEELAILKVTLDGLMWCRLLFTHSGVTPPSALKETYDKVAKAWILKTFWKRQETASLPNAERALISKKLLTAVESDKNDKLLTWSKALLDRSVPLTFMETIVDDLLLDRATSSAKYEPKDGDSVVRLLACGSRLNLLDADVAYWPTRSPNVVRKAIGRSFTTAFIQAQLIAKGCHILLAPGLSSEALHARWQGRFLTPPSHEAARLLSLDAVLEGALEERRLDDLSVSDVASHVATYLLRSSPGEQQVGSADRQWHDFLTCQLNWCTFKPLDCKDRREMVNVVRSIDTFFRVFWHKHRRNPLRTKAIPYYIRHFVNTATLEWLSGKGMRHFNGRPADRVFVKRTVGNHVFAWMPRWLAFMHSRNALFPAEVSVEADSLFENLCSDVACHVDYVTRWVGEPTGPLQSFEVSYHLRDLLKRLGAHMVAKEHVKVLLKRHTSPVTTRCNRNLYLMFLLYVWHHKCLPVDMNVIKECIEVTVNESVRYEPYDGMSVSTMQKCITKLLVTWEDPVQSPKTPDIAQEPIESEEDLLHSD